MKKIYNPQDFEKEIQKFWKKNDFFIAKKAPKKAFFSIILPPPNITGDLHLGHAWDSYYPDLLIRYKRLKGFETKWFPGLDHAGIATQAKLETILKEKNLSREELGKDKFLKYLWEWKEQRTKHIFKQWDKMGLLLNFENLKFTLDFDVNEFVLKVFVDFYNDGLIYQANKLVNWDPKLKTAISNIEVIKKEQSSWLYQVKYFSTASKEYLTVSTTRPETIFGDVALFVHPDDQRYLSFHNQLFLNPLTKKAIPLLTDEYVDREFGSGVMKATPGHDFEDYRLAKKHNLEMINIFDSNLNLNQSAGNFKGTKYRDARKKVLDYLEEKNLLLNKRKINNFVPYSQRSNAIIEPILSKQWFLKITSLVPKLLKIQEKSTKLLFFPQRFEKQYLNWLTNLEDWCISRQLWWGHQLPVWFNKQNKIKVQIANPGKDWVQSNDVLDTWFSSSLWPMIFANEDDIKNSIASDCLTDLLFTGYDILYFWVVRMVIQSFYFKKQLPFKKVILHGLIRDKDNRKMSKSLNNGIDPIETIQKWGSDSLRMFLLGNSTPGNDLKYNEQKLSYYWELNNKIINIQNLLMKWIDEFSFSDLKKTIQKGTFLDYLIYDKINDFLEIIDKNIEIYNLAVVYDKLCNLILNDFAGFYLEIVKKMPKEQKRNAVSIFLQLLIILHPFIPFLTEKLYQEYQPFFKLKKSILQERYPQKFQKKNDFNYLLFFDLIKIYRKIQLEQGYSRNLKINFYVKMIEKGDIKLLNNYLKEFKIKLFSYLETEKFNGVIITLNSGAIYYRFKEQELFFAKELNLKLKKQFIFEFERAKKLIKNPKFVEQANPELVKKERSKFAFYQKLLKKLDDNENKL